MSVETGSGWHQVLWAEVVPKGSRGCPCQPRIPNQILAPCGEQGRQAGLAGVDGVHPRHRASHQEFLGHVRQKNLAVDKAKNDWILSLDCDEQLSSQLKKSIIDIKDDLDSHDAYKMARKTYYVNRWLNHCWYPDIKVRLFNRKKAHWGGTDPHDKVIVTGGDIKLLAGDILHYSFYSISAHIQTLDKFTEIAAREIINSGKKATLLSAISRSFWMFNRMYFLKLGFLDGLAGFVASVISSGHVFVKYAKVIFHNRSLQNKL